MEDEMDIPPPVESQVNTSEKDKEPNENPVMGNSEEPKQRAASKSSIPHFEEFRAVPSADVTANETAMIFEHYLRSVPSFPWQPHEESTDATPVFEAPSLLNNKSGIVTRDQLIAGVFIEVPRSPKLWTGDQLKMRWGYNTFLTTVGESKRRTGPRLTQYLAHAALADYKNGFVEVSYEVVRRSRLVGVSEVLTVVLKGDTKRRSSRNRALHRGKPHP
ncbi:hypothetical protein [Pseudomonas abietaniphila]|uniref:hypothetical protein n=1 Tax=Pseudomonas abietaniphila TaxID=89065 RepID=UPI000B0852BF|nr:hypothetical protein [Pseudomonas abietaniphila]